VSIERDLAAALDPVVLFRCATGYEALPWQQAYLRARGDVALVKSRQIGASTAAAIRCCHVTMYANDRTALVISPTMKQSTEILNKARSAFRELGVRLRADSASVLGLRNGSRVVSLPGSARAARGYSATLLIIDEASFVPDEVFAAIGPTTIATKGITIMQSTPDVALGTFHAVASSEDDTWTRFVVPATEVSTIDPEWLERERRSLPADVFAAEYLCQFRDPGAVQLFDEDHLASLVLKE
jgi:hypothetical protein